MYLVRHERRAMTLDIPKSQEGLADSDCMAGLSRAASIHEWECRSRFAAENHDERDYNHEASLPFADHIVSLFLFFRTNSWRVTSLYIAMDPLSVTASIIAVATLAAQSTKVAYQAIDGLVEAPQAIAHSKTLLAGTQTALDGLKGTLTTRQDPQARLGSVLQALELEQALRSTQQLCETFGTTIAKYTSRSTERFSSRDRILVSFHESQIMRFNQQLGDCQKTLSLVIGTITLYVPPSAPSREN